MVGATMFGAMAADLSEYPNPLFIKDGVFDAILVVGDNAAASDVIGSVDIATNLQYQSTTTTTVQTSSAATISVSGDSKKVGQSTDKLELNESVTDTGITTVTENDLSALKEGSINNEFGTFKYNQYIDLPTGASVLFVVDPDDDEDIPAPYLVFNTSKAYNFKMTFTPAIKSDNDASDDLEDIEDKRITLLGTEYTIINVDHVATNNIKIELMGGAVQDTLQEYTTATYEIQGVDYKVEVIAISNAPQVIFKINGETTNKLNEGETFKLDDGTEIGIKTILENEGTETGGGDIVEFYLGASKVTLEDTDTSTTTASAGLTVGSDSVDNVDLQIKSNADAGTADGADVTISEITLSYTPSSELYVPVDGKLSEVAETMEGEGGNIFLDGFDIEFRGLETGTTEDIVIKPSGKDNIKVVFKNKNGDEINQEMFGVNTGTSPDTDDIRLQKRAGSNNRVIHTTAAGQVADENYVIVNDAATKGHGTILQFKSVSTGDSKYRIKDIASGETYDVTYDSSGDGDLTLPGGYTVRIENATAAASSGTLLTFNKASNFIFSQYGAKVSFIETNNTATNFDNWITIEAEETEDNVQDLIRTGNFTYDSTDGMLVGASSITAPVGGVGNVRVQVGDDRNYEGMTKYGMKIRTDEPTSGQDALTITYPDEQVTAAVFVTSGVTTVSTSTSEAGEVTTTEITPIAVGAAKLASEVADVTAVNAIVIGGPCANAAAATLVGVASTIPECLAGLSLKEGNAIVKLYENGDNVAMLVAGATALDSRRAARVLANSADYALEGMEVVVSGTTLTDITVSAPVAEVMEEEAPADDAATDDGTTA